MKIPPIQEVLPQNLIKNCKKIGKYSTQNDNYTKYQTANGKRTIYATSNDCMIVKEVDSVKDRKGSLEIVKTRYYEINRTGQGILRQKVFLCADRSKNFERYIFKVKYTPEGKPCNYNCSKNTIDNSSTVSISGEFTQKDSESEVIQNALRKLSLTPYP